jgi:hypothetical protein
MKREEMKERKKRDAEAKKRDAEASIIILLVS